MAKLVYIGFGELMASIRPKLCNDTGIQFREIPQLNFDRNTNSLEDADVFLVGPYAVDQVKQVQRASLRDQIISILVLTFPEQLNQVKQSIQLAQNISKHVQVTAYTFTKDLTEFIQSAARRAQQRKSFLKISRAPVYPAPASPAMTFHRLENFLEDSALGAIVFDERKNVISANRKAREIFHPLLDNGTTVNWTALFPGEIYPERPDVKELSELGKVHQTIKVNDQYLELDISPLHTNTTENPDYLLLMISVNQKVSVENELKRKIEELEFVNQELDEFVNVVSHDFKTPLTSISLLAELAMLGSSPDVQMKHIAQIKRSADKLKNLLKGLNELVDIKKEKSQKLECVKFADRLEFTLLEYQGMLADMAAEVITDFTDAPTINYFKAHIDSLLSNLLTNAIKYRKPGVKLRIEVKTRREREYIILTVKDNGIGIDLTKNMNKLFQPFRRLTDQATGSGLGLSIVKRMIEKDQGYLEVFSEPNTGTEFKIHLKDQAGH